MKEGQEEVKEPKSCESVIVKEGEVMKEGNIVNGRRAWGIYGL